MFSLLDTSKTCLFPVSYFCLGGVFWLDTKGAGEAKPVSDGHFTMNMDIYSNKGMFINENKVLNEHTKAALT